MVQVESNERRRYPRVSCTSNVEYQSALGLETTRAVDVSGGGMRVDGRTALAVGSDLWLKFTPPGSPRPRMMQGRVLRVGEPSEVPGQFEGFAVGFVDASGGIVEELDTSIRLYLGRTLGIAPEEVEPRKSPSPASARQPNADPARAQVTYRSERDFVDAYVHELCLGTVGVVVADPMVPGTAVEIEIELPNYYEPVRIVGEATADGESAGTGRGWKQIVRVLDRTSQPMQFIHDFASVFLSGAQATAAADAQRRATAATTAAASPPVPSRDRSVSPAPLKADAVVTATPSVPMDDLGSLVADALAGLRPPSSKGVPLAGSPAATGAERVASEAPVAEKSRSASQPSTRDVAHRPGDTDLAALVLDALNALGTPEDEAPSADPEAEMQVLAKAILGNTVETKVIENIAELVALTLDPSVEASLPRGGVLPSDPPGEPEPILRVVGTTPSDWVAALTDGDADTRAASALALGRLGSDQQGSVAALCAALSDVDHRVRRAAAWALGDLGRAASEAVPALRVQLRDADPRIRWRAVRALRSIGPAAAIAVGDLTRRLLDSDDRVRQWAQAALNDLSGIAAKSSLSTTSV